MELPFIFTRFHSCLSSQKLTFQYDSASAAETIMGAMVVSLGGALAAATSEGAMEMLSCTRHVQFMSNSNCAAQQCICFHIVSNLEQICYFPIS